MKSVSIIGGGLSGCEAALQLAANGFQVRLFDCKPVALLSAYSQSYFGELICNNSLGSTNLRTPKGLLIDELRSLGSSLISIADRNRVDDSVFLSVDKHAFSNSVTSLLNAYGVEIHSQLVSNIPDDNYVIIATGALTNAELMEDISKRFGIKRYSFYDASCPIIDIRTVDVINPNVQQLSPDLYKIEIPKNSVSELCSVLTQCADKCDSKAEAFDSTYNSYETIERAASLGIQGLIENKLSSDYSLVPHILLRRESALSNGYIIDRWTTTLRRPDQIKTITMLPGMKDCKVFKYGRMHRNSFINSPEILDEFYRIKNTNTFVVGQLSGVDDYAAAIASGWVAATKIIYGDTFESIPANTMIGGLAHYISSPTVTDFQPLCPTFAVMQCRSEDYEKESQAGILYLKNMISQR